MLLKNDPGRKRMRMTEDIPYSHGAQVSAVVLYWWHLLHQLLHVEELLLALPTWTSAARLGCTTQADALALFLMRTSDRATHLQRFDHQWSTAMETTYELTK